MTPRVQSKALLIFLVASALAACSYPGGMMKPDQGDILNRVDLSYTHSLNWMKLPDSSYVIVRDDSVKYSFTMERYDKDLNLVWSKDLGSVEPDDVFGVTLVHGKGGLVHLIRYYAEEDFDTITVSVRSYEADGGVHVNSKTLFSYDHTENDMTGYLIDPADDSSMVLFYRYDYSDVKDRDNPTLRLRTYLYDRTFGLMGNRTISIPLTRWHRSEEAGRHLVFREPTIGNDSCIYAVSMMEGAKLKVHRLHYPTGATGSFLLGLRDVEVDPTYRFGTVWIEADSTEEIFVANSFGEDEYSIDGIVATELNATTGSFDHPVTIVPRFDNLYEGQIRQGEYYRNGPTYFMIQEAKQFWDRGDDVQWRDLNVLVLDSVRNLAWRAKVVENTYGTDALLDQGATVDFIHFRVGLATSGIFATTISKSTERTVKSQRLVETGMGLWGTSLMRIDRTTFNAIVGIGEHTSLVQIRYATPAAP